MYRTLFDVAGIAMIGWLLLILLPGWRVTRKIAETAIFPVFLGVLYLVGIATLVSAEGAGFMSDFGSADGVLGLLATESVALVAWIHILAFDQVVGILIYRDNMRYRFVPLPVQSVLLFGTLMLGPIGFLAYWIARSSRARGRVAAWGEPMAVVERLAPVSPPAPALQTPRFADVVPGRGVAADVRSVLSRTPALVWLAAAGFACAGLLAVVAAINGSWQMGAEGHLLEAVKFVVALSIYYITLALIAPFAPFTEKGRRRWIAWTIGLTVYSFGIETIQALRGLDPRFSNIAGPVDQILGGFFFLSALGVLVLFLILMRGFFRPNAIPDHPMLRLALRYGFLSSMLAFAVGIAMSGLQGRVVAGTGDLMPLHAAGFHSLQAVPLVALLAGSLALRGSEARAFVHLAGVGWFVLCLGLLAQAIAGNPPAAITPQLGLSFVGGLAWASSLGGALWARTRPMPALA